MKIIFFVSPYDLLDVENNTMMNLDKETLDVGCYATVCIEAATTTNVQSTSLLSASRSSTGIKYFDIHINKLIINLIIIFIYFF